MKRFNCSLLLLSMLLSVGGSRHDGLHEDGTVRNVDLSAWKLSLVPIFHYGLELLSGNTNVRSVYRLQAKNRSEGIPMPVPAHASGSVAYNIFKHDSGVLKLRAPLLMCSASLTARLTKASVVWLARPGQNDSEVAS